MMPGMGSSQRAPAEVLIRNVGVFDGVGVLGADSVLLRDGLIAEIGATPPGGHPTQLVEMGVYPPFPTVASADDADRFVANRVSEGSEWLKILIEDGSTVGWPQPRLDAATVTALVAASHANGLRVVAHISTQADAQQCVTAGVDGLAHLFVDQPPDAAFADQAAAAGVFAIPTITIFEGLYRPSVDRRELGYVDHPRPWPYLDPAIQKVLLTDWRNHAPWQPPQWASAEHASQATRLLHQAGVPILAGTDVAFPRAVHGLSVHAELAALVDADMSASAALAAATSAPADAFGLTDRGRITPGRRADLLLVNGDPTTDITATNEITDVWRHGHRLDREACRATLHSGTDVHKDRFTNGTPGVRHGAGSGVRKRIGIRTGVMGRVNAQQVILPTLP
jgi:imidazolonepropionase-like amidohydrolase